jgi:hypothetical protein
MKKFGVFTATTFIAIILSGLYGIIHDQVTYSISPEYFTKFKYQQFGFDPASFGGDRQAVALIGFLASWWMGIFIGIMLGLTGLIFSNYKIMRRAIMNGIWVTLVTAILFAIIGFLWGKYYLIKTGVDWPLPDGLVDKNHFIIVGSVHNFSYLGGIAGILFAIIYMVRRRFFVRPNFQLTEKIKP